MKHARRDIDKEVEEVKTRVVEIKKIKEKVDLMEAQKISEAPFVLWNGPMGIYEEGYRAGTDALAVALIKGGARAIVGGGDTLAALRSIQDSTLKQGSSRPDLDEIEKSGRIFFSMGGGAMLKYLAEGTLPGLEALTRR
ncbi:MAG: hypothetical protein UY86_C0010G0039 [Candidatus Adlerbacteria bacterium GW2011_GWB1_54_7]|uniref:phosphoglycerate kinase n=1 Tax=Candidatus Adlerbacteria bacterium GW2011_GWB1_54_7 TaxID=1618607 RepID=A0A0G1Y285_9BACT|nr:MAG: hypothetical protein UY86_C0010G0039 [Candidatus Adlerbacteria bacterium GW2011_GWB1_54_7]